MTNEINELKEILNHLTVQLAAVSTKHNILENLVLSILSAKMPEDYPNIYSHFVDRYDKELNESLDNLYGVLFDTGDAAFIQRLKMELFEAVQAMKSDELYQPANQ